MLRSKTVTVALLILLAVAVLSTACLRPNWASGRPCDRSSEARRGPSIIRACS